MDASGKKHRKSISESGEYFSSVSSLSSSSTKSTSVAEMPAKSSATVVPLSVARAQDSSTLVERSYPRDRRGYPYGSENVRRFHQKTLTDYELEEIKSFSEIYYFAPAAKKQIGRFGQPRNDNYDDENKYYIVVPNDHLSYRYELLDLLGYGSYGMVVKAFDHKYCRNVAVKIFRQGASFNVSASNEVQILKYLREKDEDGKRNIVRYYDDFSFRNHLCVTFELLESDVAVLLDRNKRGVDTKIIRKIITSVLNGLEFMHANNLIHADIKPGNIGIKPGGLFECKIIDFGMSFFDNECPDNSLIQAHLYRAPEIFLRAPFSNKVDIWGVGCVCAEMAKGWMIFHGDTDVKQMATYVEHLGYPPKDLVDRSANAHLFFDVYPGGMVFKLLPGYKQCRPKSKTLEDALNINNDALFIDFLKKCLEMDPEKRYSAKQLLNHPWIKEPNTPQQSSFRCVVQ